MKQLYKVNDVKKEELELDEGKMKDIFIANQLEEERTN